MRWSVDEVIRFVRSKGISNVTEVAEAFDVSHYTARRKLDAAVYRRQLIKDEYDAEGHKLPYQFYRYGGNSDGPGDPHTPSA